MEEIKLKENELSSEIYSFSWTFWLKVFFLSFVFLIIGLSLHFPIKDYLKTQAQNALTSNPRCPISYQNLRLDLFLPYVRFNKLNVSGRCFNAPRKNLNLDYAQVKFNFLSFWPLGAKFHGIIKSDDSEINLYPKLGLSKHQIRITKTKLTGKFLSQLSPFENLVSGNFNIDSLININGSKLSNGDLKVVSEDLFISEKVIQGFPVPQLDLKNLLLALSFDQKEARLTSFKLGNSESDVELELTGDIYPNMQNMNATKLNLVGKVRFSDAIIQKISILKLLLDNKEPQNGFYKMKILGTLGLPLPSFI